VCWRTAWNTTHKPFWRSPSPRRFAWELGFGRAADRPVYQTSSDEEGDEQLCALATATLTPLDGDAPSFQKKYGVHNGRIE
jgi:hypothetical protein